MKKSRRKFIKSTGVLSAGIIAGCNAKSYGRIIGANDRVNLAIFGCNRRFTPLAESFASISSVNIVYIGDTDARRQETGVGKVKELTGNNPKTNYRIREVVQDKEVDAVVLATPDHWHAPGTWFALEAGKHVYVEKPCSHNPREGEIMVALQKKYGHIVQMGNQQRSSSLSKEIIGEIHDGVIGNAYRAVAFYSNNRGQVPDAHQVNVPEYLDWDEFQGPAPRKPYLDILGDYNWHWFWDWGTAETGNNATHEFDIARWALQVNHPHKVSVNAGKYHFVDDPWTMYDTMDATFYYENGKTLSWDGKSRNNYSTYGSGRGTIIYGSEGSVYVDRNGYRLYDRIGKLVRERTSDKAESTVSLGGGGDLTTMHCNNFIESIQGKARQNAPIDEAAISTNLCHYANISNRMDNATLEIDSITGAFRDQEVMEKYWSRTYEKGWEPPQI